MTAEFSPDSGLWSGEDLYMSQTAPAIVTHPATGERAWFNSVVNLNVLGIEPKKVRDAMQMLPGDELPTNATYGPDELIEPEPFNGDRKVVVGTGSALWKM